MTAEEFRNICKELKIRYKDVANIIGAAERSVNRWAAGTREVPEGVGLILRVVRAAKGRTIYSEVANMLQEEVKRFTLLSDKYNDVDTKRQET